MGGPLLVRELLTAPRDPRHFGLRAGYALALCVLIYTGAQATFGLTPLSSVSDIASFGAFIFHLVCYVQLALVIIAGLLFSAGNVAIEKDRRTLVLLLMTDLRSGELVLGKSLASTLPILMLIGISLPVLCCLRMLGGITLEQILWVEALSLVSLLAAAAWGTLVGYWREKTFQILAISLLGGGLFLGLMETLRAIAGGQTLFGRLAGWCNPFRTLSELLNPLTAHTAVGVHGVAAWGSVLTLAGLAAALWIFTCLRVRVWNPSRVMHVQTDESPETAESATEDSIATVQRPPRQIWNVPILWREICTQAYGRRVGLIKLAYILFAAFWVVWVSQLPPDARFVGSVNGEGLVFVVLSVLTLVLVNAQAVTSLTSERDGQTLELLLVTEVSAKEFVFGKLGGILFNTKELIAIPLLLLFVMYLRGGLSLESLIFTLLGSITLILFAAMLGLHSGFSYPGSRTAILNSLGTVIFLFVGIFICMVLIVEARTSFILQLVPFLVFILGGSLGLWMSLTHQNPSPALTLCAWALPFLTFYAIVSFLLGDTATVCAAVVLAYGFTTLAMLVPAVSAFDVALGRTSVDRG